MQKSGFADFDFLIKINGHNGISARQLFVPIQSVTRQHLGNFGGYWGMITDARSNHQSIWLNGGGQSDISFCIDKPYLPELKRRYQFDDLEDLAGSIILVFGTPQLAANGKLYCPIDNLAHIALRLT